MKNLFQPAGLPVRFLAKLTGIGVEMFGSFFGVEGIAEEFKV